MRYSLIGYITIMLIGLTNATIVSWADTENSTVDVITFENGKPKRPK